MAMSNEEFQELLKKLPPIKLEKLKKYAQELEKEDSFNEGLNFVFKNYGKTLEGLKDR